MNNVSEIVEKMNDICRQQTELTAKRNELLKGTDITWSFDKCRSLKCKYVKGCRNSCAARGILWYCIHDWILPFRDIVKTQDLYQKEEKVKEEKVKEEIVMTGIKYLVGGYGIHKNRFNTVIKETPKYYKLDNGDRIRKDTMCTDKGSTPYQDFNYRVRIATEEEIKEHVGEQNK